MLDQPKTHTRERLGTGPREVLAVLPAIGRLMVTANHLGATHERIGMVETVEFRDGWAVIGGVEHESRIELGAVAEIVVDRSSLMQGKAYPRIDLMRADGSVIAGIVGFDDLPPFDAALAPLGPGTPLAPKPEKPAPERVEAGQSDPGRVALDAAREAARPVVIGFSRPGFAQVWRGTIETVKPAMGFINVMRADFHLHLRTAAVASWREVGDKRYALDAAGQPIGLSLGTVSRTPAG